MAIDGIRQSVNLEQTDSRRPWKNGSHGKHTNQSLGIVVTFLCCIYNSNSFPPLLVVLLFFLCRGNFWCVEIQLEGRVIHDINMNIKHVVQKTVTLIFFFFLWFPSVCLFKLSSSHHHSHEFCNINKDNNLLQTL